MAELESLLDLLKAQPDAFHGLTIGTIFCFITCAARLKDDIVLTQPPEISASHAPENLPPSIRLFLGQTCNIPNSYVDICWTALKDTIWSEEVQLQGSIEPYFWEHGHAMGISTYNFSLYLKDQHPNGVISQPTASRTLYPPSAHRHMCTKTGCKRAAKGLALKKAEARTVWLYTLEEGPLPAYAVHLYCEGEVQLISTVYERL